MAHHTKRLLHLLVAFLLLPLSGEAQEGRNAEIEAGNTLWSAFECAAFASVAKLNTEQERLFKLGYEKGAIFIKAVAEGRISIQELRSGVPSGVAMYLQGPTPDFMLGRIYESALDSSLKNIFTTNGSYNPADLQVTLAETEYRKHNCALIK